MPHPFDEIPDRRATESIKWRAYPADVLPMWVADMDFRSPEPVIHALQNRIAQGIYGYPGQVDGLIEAILAWLETRHGWKIDPAAIMLVPGIVTGLNWFCNALGQPGESVLVQSPVYPPFLSAPGNAGLHLQQMPLKVWGGRYSPDAAAFDSACSAAAADGHPASLFILCNPHNPVGRVFTRPELESIAAACLRHNLTICSDEIHADLVYSESRHIPIASLDPEIAARTVTFMAPSKTFNIAGLECSFAIVPNPDLRERLQQGGRGLVGWVNLLGQVAAQAAYAEGAPWLADTLDYLQANRDYLYNYIMVEKRLPGVTMTLPEATYLAWLDCRATGIDNPYAFFLQKARVALNFGGEFGLGGPGFVRLNFGCPRPMLTKALDRMRRALEQR